MANPDAEAFNTNNTLKSEKEQMINSTISRFPIIKRLAIYLLAVVVAYLLASVTATQSVVSNLFEMGVTVGFSERLGMTIKDIAGMAGLFLPMIAAAFLAAFLIAAMICRWWPQWRTPLYIAAGAAGLITIHLTLNLALGITPIAIGRTTGGLLLQGLAGAAGGYIFLSLTQKKPL
jgi:hypothetical protein